MIMALDLSLPGMVTQAVVAATLFPAFLWIVVRLPFLKGRNAFQFMAATFIAVTVWAILVYRVPTERLWTSGDVWISLMMLAGSVLLYLEIWALLSRGYTLGLLLTLLQAERPLTASEIAFRYRGGETLGWIMRHRVAGLESAGLVKITNGRLSLRPAGMLAARLHRAFVAINGLGKTG